ncbi:MAG: sterol desaturase family protein [Methylobacterium mesophilicum]|nr:sterol desaturase family protein [Methylobacterium mesophilicum]
MAYLVPFLITLGTFLLMEFGAYAAHRWIMHGFGWGWHKSHHEEHEDTFEKNDLYAVCFALISIALFALGSFYVPALWWVALGILFYGIFYFIFHDGLVHHRWLFRNPPRNGYLKRLYQAHRLHHATEGKEGAVSFGFLYAPPIHKLKQQLRENRQA